jgi:hypothetical protein
VLKVEPMSPKSDRSFNDMRLSPQNSRIYGSRKGSTNTEDIEEQSSEEHDEVNTLIRHIEHPIETLSNLDTPFDDVQTSETTTRNTTSNRQTDR